MAQTTGERVARYWLRGSHRRWPEIFFALIGTFLLVLGFWGGFHAMPVLQGTLVLALAVIAFERRQYARIIHALEEENARLRGSAPQP